MLELEIAGKTYIAVKEEIKGSCNGCDLQGAACPYTIARDYSDCKNIYKEVPKVNDLRNRWCIQVVGESVPARIHTNYEEVMAEAERLAKANIGAEVLIYRAVKVYKAEEPQIFKGDLL